MSATNNTQTGEAVDARQGQSASSFAASFVVAIIIFAAEGFLFVLIKDRFARIYQPRTYLVPERERTTPASPGWWKWIKPVLATSNSEFVQKCGLDAYFFLRYLRTLLKLFVPAALVILPILLPLNSINGKGSHFAVGKYADQTNVTGLDQLSWGNVSPDHTGRYWAHWLLALALIIYFCYIAFDELRGYVRMRQAYMTSPQHRLRASATTVLVSSIPQKWCTVETLDGLYDVFPGGLRNIWINRNFDELNDKVGKRDKLAKALEAAETSLIKKCFKKNEKKIAKEEKEAGKKLSKEDKKRKEAVQNEKGEQNASGHGLSSGDPHQVRHNLHDTGDEEHDSETSSIAESEESLQKTRTITIPILGEGIHAMTHGLGTLGRGIMGGLRGVNKGVNDTIDNTNGFIEPSHDSGSEGLQRNRTNETTPAEQGHHRNAVTHGHLRNEKKFGTQKTPRSPAHDDNEDRDWNRGRAAGRPEDDKQPLGQPSPTSQTDGEASNQQNDHQPESKLQSVKKAVGLGGEKPEHVDYEAAFDGQLEKDDEEAGWRKYMEEKDRETMRLPIFGWEWMISLPLLGQKVDTIYYCRKEVARLNLEIEDDQAHPERFPIMNSAFVQFNHQVAAHMACQSVSHHLPKQMAPRLVEIDPNDVIWDNMSTPWWQNYIRTAIVFTIVVAMIILWAIPVAFTSALSQLNSLAGEYQFLSWILKIPPWIRSILQGVLPATFLAILMFLLPIILRLLVKLQGTQSGMLVELSVQRYYFFFLFVQLFLVVSVASVATVLIKAFKNVSSLGGVPDLLATKIPIASNYFFSYMLLQALSVSAGALVQVGGLISWFVLAPLLDSTARAKFNRQTQLSEIQWGTFFPVYTNLACIGLIYSVISPLILIFNIITFTLFWFVYRYNTLYVTKFTRDTGGLLYPNAINTTFTGVYVMEFLLIAMFLIVRDAKGNVACKGQAIGMIIILFATAIYQFLLNEAFAPLFRYLPITLEDDAVRRDEEFARAMHKKHIGLIEDEIEGQDLQDELERRERQSRDEDRNAQEYELQRIECEKRRRLDKMRSEELPDLEPYEFQNPEVSMNLDKESKGFRIMRKTAQKTADATINRLPSHLPIPMSRAGEGRPSSWANRGNRRSRNFGQNDSASQDRTNRMSRSDSFSTNSRHHHGTSHRTRRKSPGRQALERLNNLNPLLGNSADIEAQRTARNKLSDALFAGVNDELEDLTPEQRDSMVQRAFQHSALRAKRPVIWIPRDELGVSDDEVRRMAGFSKHLWVSNVRQGLDGKGRCVYSGAPPDFDEVDLIVL